MQQKQNPEKRDRKAWAKERRGGEKGEEGGEKGEEGGCREGWHGRGGKGGRHGGTLLAL